MRVKVLGSAAGGGFPQWNCACTNCSRLRQGTLKGKARSQIQLAVGQDDRWALLDASPDLRLQLESSPELTPKPSLEGQSRNTPIDSAVLTCAELDRVLGVLQLREFQPFTIYVTESVRRVLTEDNTMFRMLHRLEKQVTWQPMTPEKSFELLHGLRCLPFALPARYPEYVSFERGSQLTANEASVGLEIESTASGRRMLYLPSLPQIDDGMMTRMANCDLLFVDGTFWENDELVRVRGNGRSAREMGHIPISGPDGSLEKLRSMSRPKKIYIHINNTNPLLDKASAAFREVKKSGMTVAEDDMEFEL
ncbi:MAG TPA: pyrroloquinoline quinone biosynthesis protein PqqB [Terriglobales bacterium]|nr:pyrroloquinoline quinone biosynthesis protein PqqB [Terriglobales bacterium]